MNLLLIRQPRLAALLLISAAFVVGCSGKGGGTTHKISGVVTYNGQPVPNVSVVFNPTSASGGRPGTAITGADGKFDSATTFVSGDGVLPGPHTVTLAKVASGDEVIESAEAYSAEPAKNLPFPSKYLNTTESDLEIVINGDGQTVELALTD